MCNIPQVGWVRPNRFHIRWKCRRRVQHDWTDTYTLLIEPPLSLIIVSNQINIGSIPLCLIGKWCTLVNLCRKVFNASEVGWDWFRWSSTTLLLVKMMWETCECSVRHLGQVEYVWWVCMCVCIGTPCCSVEYSTTSAQLTRREFDSNMWNYQLLNVTFECYQQVLFQVVQWWWRWWRWWWCWNRVLYSYTVGHQYNMHCTAISANSGGGTSKNFSYITSRASFHCTAVAATVLP